MELLTKQELLTKCESLGINKCKSKNKSELIELINAKLKPTQQIKLIIEDDDEEDNNDEKDKHQKDTKDIENSIIISEANLNFNQKKNA